MCHFLLLGSVRLCSGFIKMSDNGASRKYDSGAQKRKVQKLKMIRREQLLNKIPKLTGYFSKPPTNAPDINDLENKSTSVTNPCEQTTAATTASPDTVSQFWMRVK